MTVDVQLSLRWGDQSYLNQALRQGLQGGPEQRPGRGRGRGTGRGTGRGPEVGLAGISMISGEEETTGEGVGDDPTTTPPIRSFSVTIKHARGLMPDQFGSADAYCELFYGDKLVAKTEVLSYYHH